MYGTYKTPRGLARKLNPRDVGLPKLVGFFSKLAL